MTRSPISLVAYLAAFSGLADAFWRLPCRGRAGAARIDPLMDPGEPSYHVHAVHGSSGFSMTADESDLLKGDCTSCMVKQDRSAYWFPALYFEHSNGTMEMAKEEGGMLAYYLLYGDNIKAFPPGFRMVAGDTFQRNFTWPIPDPPMAQWTGAQASQTALKQKALGFNCMNYNKPSADEGTLKRHYMPEKDWLDANCPDGLRLEIMFPSCWNGKDVDSEDLQSHVAYPSLVMDGTCPEGYETRLVSLLYETIWATHEFKGVDGRFVLANGDPTGFGNHGDFMQGWEPGVLQEAINKCTNPSGMVQDCPVFQLQSQTEMNQCKFDMPDTLEDENVLFHQGLPGGVKIENGPKYAFPIEYTTPAAPTSSPSETPDISLSLGLSVDLGGKLALGDTSPTSTPNPTPTPMTAPTAAPTPETTSTPTSTSTSTSTPTPTPTPVTSYIEAPVTTAIVRVQREITIGCEGAPIHTASENLKTLGTSSTTATETVSTTVIMETPGVEKRDAGGHVHKRGHGHGHLHRRGNML